MGKSGEKKLEMRGKSQYYVDQGPSREWRGELEGTGEENGTRAQREKRPAWVPTALPSSGSQPDAELFSSSFH